MINFSPGIVSSCVELLGLIRRKNISFAEISQSFGKVGVVSISNVLDCVHSLGWAQTDKNGIAKLSASGDRFMDIEDEAFRLRQAILDYVDAAKPSWLQNASFGRKKLLLYASKDIQQCFLEAELNKGTDPETVKFWDSLSARARGLQRDALIEIGRIGERLTLAFEKNRTGQEPKWIALESNEDGYDVLSVADRTDYKRLSIEVKTSKMKYGAKFYISRNEWEWSVNSLSHVFHLWDISCEIPKLAILSTEDVKTHVSINQGDGIWESVQIPYDAFAGKFKEHSHNECC